MTGRHAGDPIFARRLSIMRSNIDLSHARLLEVGPLANPIVHKSEADVTYVDRTDTEALRKEFKDNPAVRIDEIVGVEAVWGTLSLAECVGRTAFDYVLASHVAEHVPDLITWLQEVHDVLRPDGQLRLVLPDPRFSSDVLRPETRLVDVLSNWIIRARRPQLSNVLDFWLHHAPDMNAHEHYEGKFDLAALTPTPGFDVAIQAAQWVRDMPDLYIDVHCWILQPRSFARLMGELVQQGLLSFACVDMIDTAPPAYEFYVFLSPCRDKAKAADSWRRIEAKLHDPLPGSAAGRNARRSQQTGTVPKLRNWLMLGLARKQHARRNE